jgi:hypothetical protein
MYGIDQTLSVFPCISMPGRVINGGWTGWKVGVGRLPTAVGAASAAIGDDPNS